MKSEGKPMSDTQARSSSAILWVILAVVVLISAAILVTRCAPTGKAGHETADWYYFDWLAQAPYAPVFEVRDTESSLGPYANQTKAITIKDLIKMHGHPCDGLVTAACALSLGLRELYPDGVIDRTDTGGICNNSPCYGDVVEYLTGGRIRFGTQKIDPSMGAEFILYRFSTRQAVRVALNPGIFPTDVARLEAKIRSGDFSVADMRRCQQLEWDYARHLLQRPLVESFTVTPLEHFDWQPDAYEHLGKRGDVLNKNLDAPSQNAHP
jgi:formylmethanofuran dehydrogenase subunit E